MDDKGGTTELDPLGTARRSSAVLLGAPGSSVRLAPRLKFLFCSFESVSCALWMICLSLRRHSRSTCCCTELGEDNSLE